MLQGGIEDVFVVVSARVSEVPLAFLLPSPSARLLVVHSTTHSSTNPTPGGTHNAAPATRPPTSATTTSCRRRAWSTIEETSCALAAGLWSRIFMCPNAVPALASPPPPIRDVHPPYASASTRLICARSASGVNGYSIRRLTARRHHAADSHRRGGVVGGHGVAAGERASELEKKWFTSRRLAACRSWVPGRVPASQPASATTDVPVPAEHLNAVRSTWQASGWINIPEKLFW